MILILVHNHERTKTPWHLQAEISGIEKVEYCSVVAATILVVLGLLVLVFKLAAENCAGDSTNNAVAAHLVAAEVSSSTATHGAQKASVALLLHSGIAGTVLLLLSGLGVRVLALWVLVLAVGALLRELVLRLRAGVTSLRMLGVLSESYVREMVSKHRSVCYLPLLLLLIVVTILSYLLAMLEATLRRRAVL